MRWKKRAGIALAVCVMTALALMDLMLHWIPAIREAPSTFAATAICFGGSLGIAAAAYLCRRARRAALGRALAFTSALLLLGTLCVVTYLTRHRIASVLFAALFLLCLVEALGALKLRLPKRAANRVQRGKLFLTVEPDCTGLKLRYRGTLLKRGGTEGGHMEAVSGVESVARDFFWSREPEAVAAAIKNLLPSVAFTLSASECRITDPAGDVTPLATFLPYRYLTPEHADRLSLEREAVVFFAECAGQKSAYSVGTCEGALYLHRHAHEPFADAYYRLPDAFFFRESEAAIQAELVDWARSADTLLYQAVRDGAAHGIRFAEAFPQTAAAFGYALPAELEPPAHPPRYLPPFPYIRLYNEQPIMITKVREHEAAYNLYCIAEAKGRLYLHRRGNDWSSADGAYIEDCIYMLPRGFFSAAPEAVRLELIDMAFSSETQLRRTASGASTVRFPHGFAEMVALYREAEREPPKMLEAG